MAGSDVIATANAARLYRNVSWLPFTPAFNVTQRPEMYEFNLGLNTHAPPTDEYYGLNGVCLPVIGFLGVLGNILNLAILSWRYHKRETDVLERSALMGLMALAVSDLCFCLLLLPNALYYRPQLLFESKDFHFYFKVYGIYFQNLYIKTSTCLTVVIAAARYVGICHPLQARAFIGLFATKVAVLCTFVVWNLLLLPLLWTYSVQEIPVSNTSMYYLIDVGTLVNNHRMGQAFTYLWAIIGFFIPLAVLTYCNVHLIRALRESRRLRKASTRMLPTDRSANVRITMTLISLIVTFVVLVSPSEALHFYSEVVEVAAYRTFEVAIVVTNILQALNFAFHFALYCVVNVTFRRTLLAWCCALSRRLRTRRDRKDSVRFNSLRRTSVSRVSLSKCVTSYSNRQMETTL